MATIQCYLKELDKQRDKLANILTSKGIEADESETYNSLVEKVEQIGTGVSTIAGLACPQFQGTFRSIEGIAEIEE